MNLQRPDCHDVFSANKFWQLLFDRLFTITVNYRDRLGALAITCLVEPPASSTKLSDSLRDFQSACTLGPRPRQSRTP